MNYSHILKALIEQVEVNEKTVNISWDESQQWPAAAINFFKKNDLLVNSNAAKSLQCDGCEHACFMPIEYTEDKKRAFIVCDHMEMQSQMGRIAVPLIRLQQWQTSTKYFVLLLSKLLEFDTPPTLKKDSNIYQLGMLKGAKGRRWVTLHLSPLALIINDQAVDLHTLFYVEDERIKIDTDLLNELLNSDKPSDSNYKPNTDRQEARKNATLAMYQDWKDAYLVSKQANSTKTDTWHSQKIAKLPIGQNKSAETIRKNMK
jgi:hypothetical protein